MTRPDLTRPAAVLVDTWATTADTDNTRATLRGVCRGITSIGLDGTTPDEVMMLLTSALSDASLPPWPRTGDRWATWRARIVADVARRLSWLSDPLPDEAHCYYCGALVTAPRADLAFGDGYCPDCDRTRKVTLPEPDPVGALV